MDLLPAICIDPEGIDTWARLIESMDGLNVTLALSGGGTAKGAIADIQWGDFDTSLVLRDVDSVWQPIGSCTVYKLDIITGIVVH